ncbi:MAG: hypothetical protein V1886_02395 [archaeon]
MEGKRIMIVLGLFILSLVFLMVSASFFYSGMSLWGAVLSALFIASTVMMFRKGKKLAAAAGILMLLFALVMIVPSLLVSLGTPVSISEQEKQEILAKNHDGIDNFFRGFAERNYSIFSRDFNENIANRWNSAAFAQASISLGDFVSNDCYDAKKVVNSPEVLCRAEFRNAAAEIAIGFNAENNGIWTLFIETIAPNATLILNSKSTAESLKITFNNEPNILNASKGSIFVIVNATIKNNEQKILKIHTYKFSAGGYTFSILNPDYKPECDVLPYELKANETRTGCLVFSVDKSGTEGNVVMS